MLYSAIPAIPLAFGATRIFPGKAIRYILGNPELPLARERQLRREMVEAGLAALTRPCEKPTLFSLDG